VSERGRAWTRSTWLAISGQRDNGPVTAAEEPVPAPERAAVTVTFAGSGDAFGSGGRYQACIHLRGPSGTGPMLLDCGATSLSAPQARRARPR
jgi:hypothetical protein